MGGTDLPDFKAHLLQNVCCGNKKWTWGTVVVVFPLSQGQWQLRVHTIPHHFKELLPDSQLRTRSKASSERHWPEEYLGLGSKRVCDLTPQVVITGSLNTLQQSWQHSFTEGCSANTSGS